MSRHTKVNPDHYTIAGRLAPDDLARERWKPIDPHQGVRRRRRRQPVPPWLANDTGGNQPRASVNEPDVSAGEEHRVLRRSGDEAAQRPRAKLKPPKTVGHGLEAGKQGPQPAEDTEAATSAKCVRRKHPGAGATPMTRKTPRARGAAVRAASSPRDQRVGSGRAF